MRNALDYIMDENVLLSGVNDVPRPPIEALATMEPTALERLILRLPQYLGGEMGGLPNIIWDPIHAAQRLPELARWAEEYASGKAEFDPSLGAAAHVLTGAGVVGGIPGGLPAESAGVGITRPIIQATKRGGKLTFEHVNPFPALKGVSARTRNVFSQNALNSRAINPAARRVAYQYTTSSGAPIAGVEKAFARSVSKDLTGRSVFDDIWKGEVDRRLSYRTAKTSKGKPYVPYNVESRNVSRAESGSGNLKTAGELTAFDTSRGCVNFCPECYAFGSGTKSTRLFVEPTKIILKGDFYDNPNMIRRFGESGEPSIHPDKFAKVREAYNAAGKDFTPAELDTILEPAYDWSYTNQQFRNTNLNAPEAHSKVFVITKLNSIKNFDPTVIRNLEVSIDPLIPHHFFRSLKNIEKLKEMDPTLNISMRIRSISTYSDEVNALQKIAVDFANQHDLPVLETRLRFRHIGRAEKYMVQPDYLKSGPQFKHGSYSVEGPKVREEVKEVSPLSQMGIKKANHYICDEVNWGGAGACGKCQNCRRFTGRIEKEAEELSD